MASENTDFNEAQVEAMLKRSPWHAISRRWVSFGGNGIGVRLNWVTWLFAIVITWGFSISCIVDSNNSAIYAVGKKWVAQNFTWLYIITQDVWCLFLLYLCFSRFAKVKLGRDDEKPHYSDFTWFAMLFTCGVAVGLYVFGVAEPLYFYRQPALWHSWAYDYTHTKVAIENDAQRAQQAIFMAVYHWGIHGWVPYILLAILVGIVSYRWQMPLTIRSCFFPLFGDHSLGLLGDLIDALSMSTTTFGVCTSLGLGVTQLSKGLSYVANINCDEPTNCKAAGGKWRLNSYGANTCFDGAEPVEYQGCTAWWLQDGDAAQSSYLIIIIVITILATVSVLTGIDRGIKTLAKMAFTCGMIVMLTVLMGDNTWYILNIMVQTTGYYLNYVIQVGFDCEAFQQLGFEMQNSQGDNHLWGSNGGESLMGKLGRAGLSLAPSTGDCGDLPNPCTSGWINANLAGAVGAAQDIADGTDPAALLILSNSAIALLKSFKMSDRSIETMGVMWNGLQDAGFGSSKTLATERRNIPCGTGAINTTHFDALTYAAFGFSNDESDRNMYGDLLCDGATDEIACLRTFNGTFLEKKGVFGDVPLFPRCPETVTGPATSAWGTCTSRLITCGPTATYFGDTNKMFMDWWTIFYWAWWITWAPFVGFFVAMISRGRTIREVIIGGFIAPTLFAIMWFSVFGGLAIKMERTAELALQQRPDVAHAMVTCSEHYAAGGTPITPQSKALANEGYYMLSCVTDRDQQIYHLMKPYANLEGFLHFFLWVGLLIYFLTSSDSGSMVDDVIGASGLSAHKIPWWQKIFWCCTEGVVAIALIYTGGGGAAGKTALKALQNVSIIVGLPFTFLLCLMVPAIYRALKHEAGDEDIKTAKRFNTQLLDFFEFFKPNGGSPHAPSTHVKCILKAIFLPFVGVKACFKHMYPESSISGLLYALFAQAFIIVWFIFHIIEVSYTYFYVLAWLSYIFFVCILFSVRLEMRAKHNVYGSALDDIVAALVAWPFCLAQCEMMAMNNGEGAPLYCACIDDIKAQMAKAHGDSDEYNTVSKTAETNQV